MMFVFVPPRDLAQSSVNIPIDQLEDYYGVGFKWNTSQRFRNWEDLIIDDTFLGFVFQVDFFTDCAMVNHHLSPPSGQIVTTSAEVTLNGGLIRELPQNPLNSGLGIILILKGLLWVADFARLGTH